MGKIGSYEYPDYNLGTLIKAVEVLMKIFSGSVNDTKSFAEALGHKTEKSGGFLMKLADLRKYGLLEKRGLIATNRAKLIGNPLSQSERQKALYETVNEIKLWRDLYRRLKTKSPSSQDFKIQLSELTQDRDKVVSQGENIRNLYIDAMKYYGEDLVKGVNENSEIQELRHEKTTQQISPTDTIEKVPESIIVLKTGEVNITLPKTVSNINIIKSILDGLLIDTKTPKPEKKQNQ